MHYVAPVKRRGKIDIYTKNLMFRLNDLKQRFAHLAKTDDDYRLAHLPQFLLTSQTV